jgi:hypothetical protein
VRLFQSENKSFLEKSGMREISPVSAYKKDHSVSELFMFQQ